MRTMSLRTTASQCGKKKKKKVEAQTEALVIYAFSKGVVSAWDFWFVWWGIPSVEYIIYASFSQHPSACLLIISRLLVWLAQAFEPAWHAYWISLAVLLADGAISHLTCKTNMWRASVQLQTASSLTTSNNAVRKKKKGVSMSCWPGSGS